MFHHIPDLPTGETGYDGLVRSTEFDYADLDYSQPVTIEDELAHQGSTRFASFIRARHAVRLRAGRHAGRWSCATASTTPPTSRSRCRRSSSSTARQRSRTTFASSTPTASRTCPSGSTASTYQWVDLDGEGVSGILTEQAGAWFYKPNLGDGRFGPLQTVAAKPSLAALSSGRQQLLDLAGDGQLDLVALAGPTPGLLRAHRTTRTGSRSGRSAQLPNIALGRPEPAVRRPGRRRPRRRPDHRGRRLHLVPVAGGGRLRPGPTRPPAAGRGARPAAGLRRRHAVHLPRRHVRRRPHRPRAHPQRRGLLLAQPGLRPLRRQGHDGQRAVVRPPRPVRPAPHPPGRHRRLGHHRHHLPAAATACVSTSTSPATAGASRAACASSRASTTSPRS